jgi:hypothetical protein
MVRQGRRMDRPSQHKSYPAGLLSSGQAGGPKCWVISLAFGLIVAHSKGKVGGGGGVVWRSYQRVRRVEVGWGQDDVPVGYAGDSEDSVLHVVRVAVTRARPCCSEPV